LDVESVYREKARIFLVKKPLFRYIYNRNIFILNKRLAKYYEEI